MRALQPLGQRHLRLPAEQLAGLGDVGLPRLRVVLRQRLEDDRARAADRGPDLSANSRMVISCGLPMLTGSWKSRHQQAVDALDQVGDVAEAAGLRAVAEDGQRLAAQRLAMKFGHARGRR